MNIASIDEFSSTFSHKSCFICSKNCVSEEIVDSLLEVRGIPNMIEDKLNILKVICQLVRVRWESIESLVKDNFIFPFCLSCLKSVIQIICLREQLFTIETDIRNRVCHIQSSVAKDMEDENFESAERKYFMNEDECEVNMERGGEYAEYKEIFQKQVMNEYWSKQILTIKIEDQLQRGLASLVELSPSMVQLHFQKNMFEIVDRGDNFTASLNLKRNSCEDKETMTDVLKMEDESMNSQTLDGSNLYDTAEFILSLVDNRDEISDDSDYGSPSKKVKVGMEEHSQQLANVIESQNDTEGEEHIEKNSQSDNAWSDESRDSSDTDSHDRSSEDDEPPVFLPNTTTESANSSKNGSLILPELYTSNTNNNTELFPRASRFKNCKSKPTRGSKKPKSIKKCQLKAKKGNTANHEKNLRVCLSQDTKTFRAKDGTIWSTQSNRLNTTKQPTKLISEGLIGTAKNPNLTPVELFKLMFCPTMADTIVNYTNAYAEAFRLSQLQTQTKANRPWKPMTQDELYAYIGILIYLGLEKKRNVSRDEAWNPDPKYVTPSIIATMPRARFSEISRFLRFDDRVARNSSSGENAAQSEIETKDVPKFEIEGEYQHQSKLGYISQVFDPFVKNLQSHINPHEKLVVDEMLVKYKGKVRFRVYMKSKPGKYGMKIWVLCDATTGYILRLCIYEGKVGDNVETELGKKVVLGLVENYFESGRTVTMDNFFTSKSLGKELLKRNIKLLGTLNKNRMDVIPEFTDGRGRLVQSSIFAFQHPFSMVSYVQRMNKPVILLSTAHYSAEINPEIKNKPQMILDYNATKGGVDTADQMIGNYSCQRATSRWPMKLFQAMCDIGALNAYIIWKIHRVNESDKVSDGLRRKFLRSLSEGLMDPIIKLRALKSQASALPLAIRTAMEIMGHTIPKPVPIPPVYDDSQRRARCKLCGTTSRTRCSGCDKFICASHSTKITHCGECPFKRDKGEKLVDLDNGEKLVKLDRGRKLVKPRPIRPQILFGIQSVPNLCSE